jgi:hypothetical protein
MPRRLEISVKLSLGLGTLQQLCVYFPTAGCLFSSRIYCSSHIRGIVKVYDTGKKSTGSHTYVSVKQNVAKTDHQHILYTVHEGVLDMSASKQ